MSIYHQNGVNFCTPYFYVIEHIRTRRYYAGYKYVNPDSRNLMQTRGYQTSSGTITEIVAKEGLKAFVVRKIKHFAEAREAYDYETRFLEKIRAGKNPDWYNKHPNSSWIGCPGYNMGHGVSLETRAKIAKSNTGKKRTVETKLKQSLSKTGKKQKLEHVKARIQSNTGKKRSPEIILKMELAWEKRRLDPTKCKQCQGTKWYTNGTVNRRLKSHPGEGWTLGTNKKQKANAVGIRWWTNGVLNHRSRESPGLDWKIGRTS